MSAPELHLPEVPRLGAVSLDIADHTFSAIWETKAPAVGERRPFTPIGPWSEGLHRELLGSADARTVYLISTLGSAFVDLFDVERQDWWIDPTQHGADAYRLALPTKEMRRTRRERIAARNRWRLEDEDAGSDFSDGLDWLCGLDEPLRQSRRRPR